MPSKLIEKIAQKVSVSYCCLSVISNPDGFLTIGEVRSLLYQEQGLEIISGTNLALRIHFETHFKSNKTHRFVYICSAIDELLPDIKSDAYISDFLISDIFPMLADKNLIQKQNLDVLEILFARTGIKRVSMMDCQCLVSSIKSELESKKTISADTYCQRLRNINVDWSKMDETCSALSAIVADAIRDGVYDNLDKELKSINDSFQTWIDSSYFAMQNSSPLLRPKCVNRILPHLSSKYCHDEKLALIVVDGITYWQYLLLKSRLYASDIATRDSSTLSWIPSITMLSRQAIFRGGPPLLDYRQSPQNEKKLWNNFWQAEGFEPHQILYLSNSDDFAFDVYVKRLAYVTVEMDDKMHSSTDYKDLYSLTVNWADRFISKVKDILEAGFAVYLTTDHGSILSKGWRLLSTEEKIYLYADGSRGARHLIYNDANEQNRFIADNAEINLLQHDNWLCMRTPICFAKGGNIMITHGGCHWMEVVIPFIKIG